MTLSDYRTLGRSGLVVSPLALGTMTFGTARWGTGEDVSRAVFDAYVDAGGNFVDTADVYSSGRSEEMVGAFVADRKLRDQIVIATKAGFSTGQGPHAGGHGARHLHTSLEGSLRRLRTEFVDLFWIHVWDSVTPAEELLETMAGLVRSGRIRYWGLSNAPKLVALASARGMPGPIGLQYFYSLVNRDIEDEHVPLAAIQAWVSCLGARWPMASSRASTTEQPSRRPRRGPADCRAKPRPQGTAERSMTSVSTGPIRSATRSSRIETGTSWTRLSALPPRLGRHLPASPSHGSSAGPALQRP